MNASLRLDADGAMVGVFDHCWDFFGVPSKIVAVGELVSLTSEFRANKYAFTGPPPSYVKYITAAAPKAPPRFDWSRVPQSTMDAIKPYQTAAIDAIVERHNWRAIVGAVPGSGKTLMGSLCGGSFYGPVLFIVPSAKCADWIAEYAQWTCGTMTEVKTRVSELRSRVVVCSYDKACHNRHVRGVRWDAVIVDECHKLKNDNDTTRALIPDILIPCKAVILLSGTPQESGTAELFNLLRIVAPQTFGSRQEFTERYSDGHFNAWRVWEERGAKNLEELNLLLSKCMIRIKEEVLQLPDITRVLVRVDWKGTDSASVAELERGLKELQEKKRMELVAVRQGRGEVGRAAALNMRINTRINEIWAENGNIKSRVGLDACRDILERHPKDGIVFFTYHIHPAKQIHAALTAMKYEPVLGTGELSVKARLEVLNGLRDGIARVGVLTMDACGTGFNLSPGVSVVVFMQLHNNEAKMEQCEGRAYRLTANRQVYSYWIVLKNSRDEQLYSKLQSRKAVNKRVLDGEDGKIEFKKSAF